MLTEKDLQFPLEPCPFCESEKIKYSLKKTGRFELHYHACMYCADCHTYGPRVLSASFRHDDYIARRDVENDAELLARAGQAWNKRGGVV